MKLVKLFYYITVKQSRDMAYSVWILVMPPLLYLSLRLFFPGAAEGGALISGVTLFLSLTAGLMNQPLLYAQMRDDRMLDRIRATPVRSLNIQLSLIAATFTLSLAGSILIASIGILFGDLLLDSIAGYLFVSGAASLLFLLSGIPFPFLIRDFPLLKNVSSSIATALFVLAGVFFTLPGGWRIVHTMNPASGAYENLRLAVTSSALSVTSFVPVLVFSTIGVIAGIVLSRRHA